MDSHYHKVMKAREDIQENGTKMYFGYSGVLDRNAFEQWKDEHSYHFFELPEGDIAVAENFDLTFDFPSRWWGGRVAGLCEKPGSKVYGRLYEIPATNWPVVQHKEGVITGMSIEIPIAVMVNGKKVDAFAFTTNPIRARQEGPVSERYLQALVAGATQAGLPAEYIQSLQEKAK